MKFKKKILKNGLRLITVPMPDNPSVTVLLMVEAGSKYETKDINGLSHFLEHMVFKGTERRPKSIDIKRELDMVGANYNAFTGHEVTGYYAKADKKHYSKILDIVSDMYLHPIFPEAEIEKEKGVIIEEIRMYNDLPQQKVHEAYNELLFGEQPAGWTILGPEENIRSFNREKLLSYRQGHYLPQATTMIVAGNMKEGDVYRDVKKIFEKTLSGRKQSKLAVKEAQSEPAIKALYKETDQTHLVIGFRAFSIFDKKNPIIALLTTVLGGGMSSRLFSKMRDDLGICYYVNASHETLTDHGDVSISAGVDNRRVEEGIRGILDECKRLKEEIVPEAELQKAKDYLCGTMMLGLETSDSRAEFLGIQEVLKGEVEKPEEVIKKIQQVKASQIKKIANDIFVNENLNMAIIGKYKDTQIFRPYFSV